MNRSIVLVFATVLTVAILLSCQYDKSAVWDSPLDPGGANYHPPAVSLRDTAIREGSVVRILSNASSANSTIESTTWIVNGAKQAFHGPSLEIASWPAGSYVVIASATDANGLVGSPDTATVTVRADLLPVLVACGDTTVDKGLERILSATDSDGEVVRYLWGVEKGVWMDSSESGSLSLFGLLAGDHVVYWGARDDAGKVATDSFTLSVIVGNLLPVLAEKIRDTVLSASQTFSVVVGASDPDGSISSFAWDTAATGCRNSTAGPISLAIPKGDTAFVRWRARDDQGGETADTFRVIFVGTPVIDSLEVDSNLASGSGDTGTISFRWNGSVPGMASEPVTWALYIGGSADARIEVYSGASRTFDDTGVATGAVRSYRLVAKNRVGDSVEREGSATGVIRPQTAYGIPWNQSVNYGFFKDDRDGHDYATVDVGGKTWMAQNLNYSASGTVGMCPGTNGGATSGTEDSCSKYGRLYTWYEVMDGASTSSSSPSGVPGICPSGWHVPSYAEWKTMQDSVDAGNTILAARLKAGGIWSDYDGGKGNGTDDYGFRAVPAGYCFAPEAYPSLWFCGGGHAYWWTTTETAAYNANAPYLSYVLDNVTNSTESKGSSYSLRCVRDERIPLSW